MAQPTSVIMGCATLSAGTATGSSVSLQFDRQYTVVHNALDISAGASTSPIFMSSAAIGAADYTAEGGKWPLKTGTSVIIGPGISTLYFQAGAGAPTFSLSAGPRLSLGNQ